MAERHLFIGINSRYLVSESESQPAGAASFINSVARVAVGLDIRVYFIAFLRTTKTSRAFWDGQNANILRVEVSFDDRPRVVENHMFLAITSRLSDVSPSDVHIWYQSLVFVPFHPLVFTGSVTSHAPFVSEVVRRFGANCAAEAFQGGAEKVKHLMRWQHLALDCIKSNKRFECWEFSSVQVTILLNEGVLSAQIVEFFPDFVHISLREHSADVRTIVDWTNHSSTQVLLVNCSARIDGFKNLEELARAFSVLRERRRRVSLVLTVGGADEEPHRRRILESIPRAYRSAVFCRERLRQGEMLALFDCFGARGIFIFPSIYETFGITPVQADAAGLRVVLNCNCELIGCSGYISRPVCWDQSSRSLEDVIDDSLLRPVRVADLNDFAHQRRAAGVGCQGLLLRRFGGTGPCR